MDIRKTKDQHFRIDEITEKQLDELEKILNSNSSLLDDSDLITRSQIIRTAIHREYAKMVKSNSQDMNTLLIREQLSQILQPELTDIVNSLQKICRKLNR
ncbi:MAG: hypothetical protein LKE61_03905 [Erysipelotrichaceae bacterium]|jgi:hypothetical protein|nr:hypothetical protein [Erysipelotrichaceae bacterium]MCH4045005.1 hypothetical protein [Erysipelotrichaceae bacterium]MCH4122217.1 hypothetical protein [Erysipelotrichaceae bacterium]MCI1362423.1 hypothetical protein [Solobacterium sp.]MCI1462279.1 hypothetical protein [Solobacterium sp.]